MSRLPSSLKVLALVPAVLASLSLPAFAGQAENALLAKYAGVWRGTGEVTGPDPGKVVCRLTFKPAESGELSYSGRCTFGAGGYGFRGVMSYNDARGRFESSSSVQGETITTTGKRSGGGVSFASGGIETRYGTASSSFQLASSGIKLSFKLVDKKGRTTSSAVSFARK